MFIENKTEKIVRGIFIGGIVYFIGYILPYLATLSSTSSKIGHYITLGIFYIGTFGKPIGLILIFKFSCDVLYKILKAIDNYNKDE